MTISGVIDCGVDSCTESEVMQHDLYKPGIYVVEVTDHGISTDGSGQWSFWLEFLPHARWVDVGKKGVKLGSRKVRVILSAGSGEYGGDYESPTDIRADVLLRCKGISDLSKDPHDLIGRRLDFSCAQLKQAGELREKWLLVSQKKRRPSIFDLYD